MLGSLKSSSSSHSRSHDHQEEAEVEEEDASASNLEMRKILVSCAEFVSRSDYAAAHRLVSVLLANSSPLGDSMERLVNQLAKALSCRMNNIWSASSSSPSLAAADLQSCYLSLNQITPFIRFSHLTANQAILEAMQVGQESIHILDLDIMHGVQWPPLMQALAERSPAPPTLRITGTGQDLNILNRTGDRLLMFAQSLGLHFQFQPLLLLEEKATSLALHLPPPLPDETLAVNCVHYLHRLLTDDTRHLQALLQRIKELNPKVVTLAEREASHNQPLFLERFVEGIDHYGAIFDSLEATVPPNSKERLGLEQIWFGREMMDIMAGQGEGRRERHERFECWEMMFRSAGFENVPLSPFALSQAKLLLRLHYPSEGYQLSFLNNNFLSLGWQNRPLFSVSSWH